MTHDRGKARDIDEYIAAFAPDIQAILARIRRTIRKAAPHAEETISYRMPAFTQNGILVYFAAFKNHIGLYPPVSGDTHIAKAIEPYAGPKGNLQFPFAKRMPHKLIGQIVRLRVKQNAAKAVVKERKKLNASFPTRKIL